MILNEKELKQTIHNLNKEYNIIGNILYFSQFLTTGGETEIFNHLNNIRKNEFLNNDQIIFVQDCLDIYEYDASANSPGKLLSFIQKYLEKIDITNCFVTIVSSNPSISEEIHTVNELHSNIDDTLIKCVKINGIYKKELSKQDTFCALAWKEFNLKPDGSIIPCCSYDRPHSLGSLKNDKLENILNEKESRTLKYNMLNDIKSPGCESCYYLEKHGKSSRRLENNKIINFSKEDAKKITTQDGEIDYSNFFFNKIELALDSTCNLKCRCCSGDSSTMIALEEEKIFKYTYNKDKILNSQEKNIIIDRVKPCLFNTRCISFAGGEPTLIKGQYEILDFLLDNGLTTTELRYAINGSNLTFKNKSILDYWNKFKSVNVNISADGYKQQFEYLRHGSKWDIFIENIKKIKKTCPHVILGINSVISFLSLESTIKLQTELHKQRIILGNLFGMILINGHDDSYDIQTLPLHHKKRLSLIIDNHREWLEIENQHVLAKRWHEIKNYMLSENKQHKLIQAKRDIDLIDSFRNENFYDTFPELSDIFDNVMETKH